MEIVTVREATERLREIGIHVSSYAIRCWIASGELPVRKVNKKTLIHFPTLLNYLTNFDHTEGSERNE